MPQGTLKVRLFDANRNPFPARQTPVLMTVFDNAQNQLVRKYYKANVLRWALNLQNGWRDALRVLAWADGYLQAGQTGVQPKVNGEVEVDLMLIPRESTLNFSAAVLDRMETSRPEMFRFLTAQNGSGESPDVPYDLLMEDHPDALATMLNVLTAFEGLLLPDGRTALSHLVRPNWACTNRWVSERKPDRFFAYTSPAMKDQVRLSPDFTGAGASEHWCRDASYKEVTFREANVQFSFCTEGAGGCGGAVHNGIVDCDMDYYRSTAAHFLLEYLPNLLGGRTNPRRTFVMRWMETRRVQRQRPELKLQEYRPPYRILPA